MKTEEALQDKHRLSYYTEVDWFKDEAINTEAILAMPVPYQEALIKAISLSDAEAVGELFLKALKDYMPDPSDDHFEENVGHSVIDISMDEGDETVGQAFLRTYSRERWW